MILILLRCFSHLGSPSLNPQGYAAESKLPLNFVHGIQLLYELQTLMLPIVNYTQPPMPKGFEALARIPWRGPGCTGIIATCADGTVSHARNLDFSPVRYAQIPPARALSLSLSLPQNFPLQSVRYRHHHHHNDNNSVAGPMPFTHVRGFCLFPGARHDALGLHRHLSEGK